jgi:hypothetical protein
MAAPSPIELNTVVIQPNATVGKDTWIGNTTVWINEDRNFGTDSLLYTANSGLTQEIHSLLQFDVPVNPLAKVQSATLTLVTTGSVSNPQNVSVHAVTNDWDEGIYDGAVGAANWQMRTGGKIFAQDFEITDGGLIETNDWVYGTYGPWVGVDPQSIPPPSPHSGTHMWGTIMNSEYSNLGGWSNLTFILDLTGTTNPVLTFWDWYDVFENFDHGEVYVNGNLVLDRGTDYVPETDWSLQALDLSAYDGGVAVITFSLYATTVVSRAGWYIDDFTLYDNDAAMWTNKGGDYLESPNSYQTVAYNAVAYSWDVTAMVANFTSGNWTNNGFLLKRQNLETGDHYIGYYSSDAGNPNNRPKLTISYAVEISVPIGAQVMQEDDAARRLPLSGRGAGCVEHTSSVGTSGNYIPFWGTTTDIMHVQYLYLANEVGAEGTLRKISFNRSVPTATGTFNNFRIMMGHTDLTTITNTFANNYMGYLTEVFPTQTVFVNSSNGDRWIHFDLNGNFTYDNAHNLIIDITWNGDSGDEIALRRISAGNNRRLWDIVGAATGTPDTDLHSARFLVDATNNAVIDSGIASNFWPFAADDVDEMRCQMLYNSSYINQTGHINQIAFQAYATAIEWSEMENFSVRIAHSTNDTLGNVFEAHRSSAWVEVLSRAVYNFSTVGRPEWIPIVFDTPFNYDGSSNLLVEIRWFGDNGGSLNGVHLARDVAGYNSRLCVNDVDAVSAVDLSTTLYNTRFIFGNSAHLTWSAVSNMPLLFSAIVTNRELIITPQANQHGVGSVTLTLTNSNGESTSQLIQVTINAVNDAPVLAPISPITCVEDVPYVLNIQSLITDIDDPIANITVRTSSTFATVNGTIIRFLYPEGLAHENVTVTIRDRNGLEDSEILLVTVSQINDPPTFAAFPTTITCDATIAKAVPLNPDDEETNDANLQIYTNSEYINVTGHTLHLLYPKGIGTETVTVYLVDELTYGTQNNVSYTMVVTIIDHPEVVANTPTGASVSIGSTVQVTFDVSMNATKAENAFSLKFGTAAINGTFAWNAAGTIMTFTPSSYMLAGNYSVSIAASAEDLDGVKMLSAFNWYFTVAYADYDGDGMPDSWEIQYGLDPTVNDAAGDLDGDGMPNLYEYQNNLNPAVNDADADSDGDGYTNLEEYEAGTDPNDPESAPSDFAWIILLLVLVAIIAVVLVLVMLMRKKKPAPAPEYQEGNYPPPPAQEPYYPPPEGQNAAEPNAPEELPPDQA